APYRVCLRQPWSLWHPCNQAPVLSTSRPFAHGRLEQFPHAESHSRQRKAKHRNSEGSHFVDFPRPITPKGCPRPKLCPDHATRRRPKNPNHPAYGRTRPAVGITEAHL